MKYNCASNTSLRRPLKLLHPSRHCSQTRPQSQSNIVATQRPCRLTSQAWKKSFVSTLAGCSSKTCLCKLVQHETLLRRVALARLGVQTLRPIEFGWVLSCALTTSSSWNRCEHTELLVEAKLFLLRCKRQSSPKQVARHLVPEWKSWHLRLHMDNCEEFRVVIIDSHLLCFVCQRTLFSFTSVAQPFQTVPLPLMGWVLNWNQASRLAFGLDLRVSFW